MSKKLFFFTVIIGALLGYVASCTATTINVKELGDAARQMPAAGAILSYNDAIKEAKKSVVNISTQKAIKQQAVVNPFMNDPFFREFFGRNFGQTAPQERMQRSLGSGVIIGENGYIVTNNHVVESADKIMVTIPGSKKEYEAKIIGSDPKSDLAVIKIEADKLQAISFSDSSKAKEGDVVFAIGNPFGVGETITHGIVSALNKTGMGINDYENFIQTDAPINPGNSGGALVDSRGGLLGINSAIISKSGASAGIGFAIPSNMAKSIAKQLIENGKIERGFMGVNLASLDESKQKYYGHSQGAVVTDVSKDTPAQRAGIKRGDLIVSANSKVIEGPAELRNLVGSLPPGSIVKLEIIRNKKKIALSVKLDKAPTKEIEKEGSLAGMGLSSLNEAARKKHNIPENIKGVLVESVKDDSVAAKAGIAAADVIVQVEDTLIDSIDDLKTALKESQESKRVYLYRQGAIIMVVLEK